ncbi:hypothetical protein E1293_02205 [Actinomadura darangshiensis]|uniref:Uncharacterized protein n=1 Tax=Actinomadura darangshiensis TaxID=705336 RepID=A0A4V2YY16_9ACTN|nr:hypothetical protein E1293_02205 [Actinomadura darangshiensis]
MRGNPDVGPWPGSAEEREALRARAEADRLARERVATALRIADFGAAEAAGYESAAVRRLALLNAETGGDLRDLAHRLNIEGHAGQDGSAWDAIRVADCIALLWPYDSHDRWPSEFGTYPGYLGGLRDGLTITMPFQAIGPRRHQFRCTRCDALWPTGWPDADHRDPYQRHCPDCRMPGGATGVEEEGREHSIIDLHWLMFRFAPSPAGPCPVCGGARELVARGYFGIQERVLYWSCGQADELGTRGQPDSHYMRSLTRAEWESAGAHHAYWLAVDMLRMAGHTGEVTELPVGAEYEALDGSGERWTYRESGWESGASC